METYRVLIVDDEPEFRDLLVEALESMGYQVEGAESAETALTKIQDRHGEPNFQAPEARPKTSLKLASCPPQSDEVRVSRSWRASHPPHLHPDRG